jgi:phospholipid/cholesterol/gamma-HCH transport system substrate-binding protein
MRIHSWAIGLFLTLGILLFTAILFLIGNRHDIFGKHVEFYAEFSNTGGLPRGAQVRVSGIEAGEVKSIEIPASPASKFRLKLQVRANARGLIRTDSLVSIQTEGIVGDKFIFIREGTRAAPEAPDGATFRVRSPSIWGRRSRRVPRCWTKVPRWWTTFRAVLLIFTAGSTSRSIR